MLRTTVLIFSFCFSIVVFGQDARLLPSNNMTSCALSKDCKVVFADVKSGSKTSYTVKMFDTKDVQMNDSAVIVLKMYDTGKPFVAGVVTDGGIDLSKSVQEADGLNTYTSFTDSKILKLGKLDKDWHATFLTEALVSGFGPDEAPKPPPTCPPDCNAKFYFIPAAEYMADYGDSFKSLMAMPSLVPVFISNR